MLLEAQRYDEALSAFGIWSREMERELLLQIDQARRTGDRQRILGLYEAYLAYYPLAT